MIIHLHGSPGKPPVEKHILICAPAGHLPKEYPLGKDGEVNDFWDQSGDHPTPRQFQVEFRFGKAEVSDSLGRYLVQTGQAQKSRLILPNSWDH
jgi:hypothetical protein